ncbi:hypothetical protein LJC22_00745 [Desulfosarcina sp. OttesenSCG-928-G10]|nr:hypothetical protein [Desulfosarcina sp. OttesenSCG-928-G10]MDL2321833.1 hypothetical protein [Desulfosarcina sp. OttesenSCG-928-B08]
MPTLTIHNVSSEMLDRLRDRATRQGRSLEQEVKEMLNYHLISRSELIDTIMAQWHQLPDPPSAKTVADWILAGRRGDA